MKNYIQSIKRIIKLVLAYSLYYSGILLLIKKILLKDKIIVLTYHRVLPYRLRAKSSSHSAIMVDPDNFDRQLLFIKRHFNIINSKELIESFDNKRCQNGTACLITFDDGWLDNYQYAYPVLHKHALSALIFVATDYIGNDKLFWQEAMGHGLRQIVEMKSYDSTQFLKKHNMDSLINVDNNIQNDMIRNHVRELKSLPYDNLDNIIYDIIKILGNIDYGNVDKYLSWQQIKEMHSNGIEFGSHACSHKILTRLDDQTITDELLKSKNMIEDNLSEKIDSIAYPNGDYNKNLGVLTDRCGYKIGFGTNHGFISCIDDRFNIKRININDTTATNNPIMLATILGIF